MRWRRWRGRQDEARLLAKRSADLRKESAELRRQLLATTARLDAFVALLAAEVQHQQAREGEVGDE